MSTYTINQQEHRHHGATAWTLHHPMASTIGALFAAVVAGVLIGILFSLLSSGAETGALHRAGGHALATVAAAQHAATAATSDTVIAATTTGARSPARGGFAVGRTSGAGSGFIVISPGDRAPARGGFAGRSLGAGV